MGKTLPCSANIRMTEAIDGKIDFLKLDTHPNYYPENVRQAGAYRNSDFKGENPQAFFEKLLKGNKKSEIVIEVGSAKDPPKFYVLQAGFVPPDIKIGALYLFGGTIDYAGKCPSVGPGVGYVGKVVYLDTDANVKKP